MATWVLALGLLPIVLASHGPSSEYFDVLGTGRREWRLAFRGSAGVGTSVFQAYVHGTNCPRSLPVYCTSLNYHPQCYNHYRNSEALDNWGKANVREVLLAVVAGGKLAKVIRFNGQGTNYLNWFSQEKYLDSSWGDIGSVHKNFFSIEGDAHIYRRFFINKNYGGCDNDAGWLVVVDTPLPPCPWERKLGAFPQFLYAAGHTVENYTRGKVKSADAILIFLRYNPTPPEPEVPFNIPGTGQADWRLAFRATAHVGASAYHAYLNANSAPTLTQRACRTLDFQSPCASHYRNSAILDNWSNIKEVLVAVVDGGQVVKKIIFSGQKTDFLTWFDQHRYITSSWADLATEKKNFFSIRSDDRLSRRFFINHVYAGCAHDVGWLVFAENPAPPCDWEKGGEIPVIKYAAGNVKENWTTGRVSTADAILIFVRIVPPRGFPDEYFDVLGSGHPEWRLAFRGTASVGCSMYHAYRDGSGIPAVVKPACKNLDFRHPCDSHYRNSHALDNWSNVQEVLVAIVDDGAIVKVIKFSGSRTNFLSWFGPHFLLYSPWHDLWKESRNVFSIIGHDHLRRRFFINHQYGGCENDAGWLVVVEGNVCPWEKGVPLPVIKYAAGLSKENWTNGRFKNADAILVFLKYPPGPGHPDEYFDVLSCGLSEWRLAFRATANVGTSVFDAYVDGTNVPAVVDPACKNTDWTQPCHSHYRNADALDNWTNVKEVLLAVVDGGVVVKTARFDGQGSTFLDWLDKGRLLEASWADLAGKASDFFSIAGDAHQFRRFFISQNSNACAHASGWLVAVDAHKPTGCVWEKTQKFPILKYSAGPVFARWDCGRARDADAFVVFVKYAK